MWVKEYPSVLSIFLPIFEDCDTWAGNRLCVGVSTFAIKSWNQPVTSPGIVENGMKTIWLNNDALKKKWGLLFF